MSRDGRINDRAWRRLRDQVVREEPTCQLRLEGCTGVSTTADHVLPRSQFPELSHARSNLRGSCENCNRKRGADNRAKPPKPELQPALTMLNTPSPPWFANDGTVVWTRDDGAQHGGITYVESKRERRNDIDDNAIDQPDHNWTE